VLIQTLVLAFYIWTVVRRVRVPPVCHFLADIPNLHLHADFTVWAFISSLFLIAIALAPGCYYAWSHYALSATSTHIQVTTLDATKLATLLLVWVTSGCMRRGPLLRYNEIKLGTGFGVSASTDIEADPTGPNVIDWRGCPMLKLVTLSQVSSAPT
jgi:hypothetical protein